MGLSEQEIIELGAALQLRLYSNNNSSIRSIVTGLEVDYALDEGAGLFLFRYLVVIKAVRLNMNIPIDLSSSASVIKFDWKIRDKEILQHVKQTVQEILDSEEKPQRISLRLVKTRSGNKSFDLQLDKLPLTKVFIDSAIETPMDLHKRRIRWAINKLNEEG